jgi:hypothetical protein
MPPEQIFNRDAVIPSLFTDDPASSEEHCVTPDRKLTSQPRQRCSQSTSNAILVAWNISYG